MVTVLSEENDLKVSVDWSAGCHVKEAKEEGGAKIST